MVENLIIEWNVTIFNRIEDPSCGAICNRKSLVDDAVPRLVAASDLGLLFLSCLFRFFFAINSPPHKMIGFDAPLCWKQCFLRRALIWLGESRARKR